MSAKVLDQLKCGNCGNDQLTVYSWSDPHSGRFGGGPTFAGALQFHCKCGVVTQVGPTGMSVEDIHGDGGICGGWR